MTEKEIKRWLMRGKNIQRRIASLEASKAEAWDSATRVNASAGAARGAGGVGRRPERYGELSAQLDQEWKRLDRTLAEITRAVALVEDNTLAALLQERYVNGKTWAGVAAGIGYEYSYTVRKLHPKALRAVKEAIESHCQPVV